jgi:hypothetical protein
VARSNKKETAPADRQQVAVSYRLIPYFGVECDSPALSGIRGVGETPLKALVNMRGEVMKRFPQRHYNVSETISNPEMATGWKMPEPF